jgi:hypothetical protein
LKKTKKRRKPNAYKNIIGLQIAKRVYIFYIEKIKKVKQNRDTKINEIVNLKKEETTI